MKNIFLIIMIFPLILASCEKNQSSVGAPDIPIDTIQTPIDSPIIELGKGYVLKNGIIWNVPFQAWYYQTSNLFQIWVDITYPNYRGEHFFITDIPCKKGMYTIENWAHLIPRNQIPECFLRMTQDLDQGIGSFSTDTTRSDHFIEVIKYDSTTQTVEGRFQVFLKKEPSNTVWPGVPDSIFLTEGKFHLKIQEP